MFIRWKRSKYCVLARLANVHVDLSVIVMKGSTLNPFTLHCLLNMYLTGRPHTSAIKKVLVIHNIYIT